MLAARPIPSMPGKSLGRALRKGAMPQATRRGERLCAAVAAAFVLLQSSACTALLPQSQERTTMPWLDYESASAAVDAITPGQTRVEELLNNGFRPDSNPAVAWLSWPELLQRFAALGAIEPLKIDPGLRECLSESERCKALGVNARNLKRERIGNFWLDSMSFQRTLRTSGWTFNAVIVFVDGTVVFRSHGGQPRVEQTQDFRNPLGPLQSWGDALGPALIP
jgi:hypothetical protein